MRNRLLGLLAALLVVAGSGSVGAQPYPMAPPPAMPYEAVPPPPPGPAVMAWRPGHWRWTGRAYVWVPGHYLRGPRPGAVWVPGHWVDRHGRWVWIEGHWR